MDICMLQHSGAVIEGCIRWPDADLLAPGRQSVKIQLSARLGSGKYEMISKGQSWMDGQYWGNN